MMDTLDEPWGEKTQVRHAAMCTWPSLSSGDEEYLRLCSRLREYGYDGCIDSLDSRSIIQMWRKVGWMLLSADGNYVRLTPEGKEQLETWREEDRIWKTRDDESIPLPKRLVAGEPARNLRKIKTLLASSTIIGIHDPYIRTGSLETLLKLSDMGTMIGSSLRMLGCPIAKVTERASLLAFLKDVNAERSCNWEIRTYTAVSKPHRRFFVLDGGSVVTCGMSLNHIDKNEVLDRLGSSTDYAKHDCQFFEYQWENGTPI